MVIKIEVTFFELFWEELDIGKYGLGTTDGRETILFIYDFMFALGEGEPVENEGERKQTT